MTEFLQLLSLLTSSGVFAMGVGAIKWGWSVEKRLTILEVKTGVQK